jgi:hypothetical protein
MSARGSPMTFRFLRSVPLFVLAAAALPALAQTPPEPPSVPHHNCTAPAYPGRDANKAEVDKFNADYKAYGDCMKKYVEETNRWLKATADEVNKAIDEYNKYTENLKKKIEEDKK